MIKDSSALRSNRPARSGFAAYEWLAEAALITLSVVVAFSIARLFTDSSLLGEVLLLAVGSHLLLAAARVMQLRHSVTVLIWVAALLITSTALFYPDTTWWMLPTADTVNAARLHSEQAWDVINASPAPVEPVPGLVLFVGLTLALCALLAETAAFNRRSMIIAVLPASAVYIFTIAVSSNASSTNDDVADSSLPDTSLADSSLPEASLSDTFLSDTFLSDALSAVLFCSAVALSIFTGRLRDRSTETWIEPRTGRGVFAMARSGLVMLALAVLAAAAASPLLPSEPPWIDLTNLKITEAAPWVDDYNTDPEPWIDFASTNETSSLNDPDTTRSSGPRILVSPMVQIRSRLTQVADQELFTVQVQDLPQYWRLTSLDEFNGNEWRASSNYEQAQGPLPASFDPTVTRASLIQTISLTGLGNSYLPVAYEAQRVLHDGGVAMEYEASSGSLIKSRSAALQGSNRFTYAVESAVPVINSPDRLHNSDATMLNAEFLALNTQLPEAAKDLVLEEAQRITRNGVSDYDRALLLQDYFRRSGGFRYDLDVAASGGVESLEDFLFNVRAGYCQQFASAYAAMARSIDLPTRVAVGFTWGEWDPARSREGAYVVRGEHAHAWPEVYFAGTGWVRFEPTVGRGGPGDFAVTGYGANQAGSDTSETLSPVTETDPAPVVDDATTGGPAELAGVANVENTPPAPADAEVNDEDVAESKSLVEMLLQPLPLTVLLLVALALLSGLMPVLRRLRHRQVRASLANNPAGLIEESWSDVLQALALAQIRPTSFETPLELARRVAAELPDGGPVNELAVLTTHGRYAPITSQAMAERAEVAGSAVIMACRERMSRWQRLTASLNTETVLRPRPRLR